MCYGAILWLTVTSFCEAANVTWSTPLGSVTLFGSGNRTTFLQTSAALGDVSVSDSLNYLDAGSSPVVSRSEAAKGDASFVSLAQLSVGESQTEGTPVTSGSLGFASTGGGMGTGTAGITLYFLINVPSPVTIELDDVRSSITTSGLPADAFSLNLFQSDATGGKFGDAVLSLAGEYLDQSVSYQSSTPYYLLEMNVSANATLTSSDAVEFSYLLDLTPAAAVPEPNSTALLLGAIAVGLALKKAGGLRRMRLGRNGRS